MVPILQFSKHLTAAPAVVPFPNSDELAGLTIRNYQGTADIIPWLDLRSLAFAKSRLGLAQWNLADFQREFLKKPWWNPGRMWLAELPALSCSEVKPSGNLGLALPPPGKPRLIGTVTLTERSLADATIPAVNWLMVAPRYQRLGLGKLLMNCLESAVWQRGDREIQLETHQAWEAAVELYQKLDYSQKGR